MDNEKIKQIEELLKESDENCDCLEGSKSYIGDIKIFTCYKCGGQFIIV